MSVDKNDKLDYNKCVVLNCDNGQQNNYTLFRIPRKSERRKVWLEVIGNPSLMKCSAAFLDKAGVCKNHFYADSFLNSEKKKLRPLANPVNLNVPQIAQLRANISSFTVTSRNNEMSNTQTIANKDYSGNSNNDFKTSNLKITNLTNVPSWSTFPAKTVNINNENYVCNELINDIQMKDNHFKRDEDEITKTISGKQLNSGFNNNDNEMNLLFEPLGFRNNRALKDNVTEIFEKPQTVTSQNSIVDNILSDNELKEKILALEKENIMLKKKLRKFEKINRDRIDLLQKFSLLQKKTAKQEKIITSLCEEINFLRK